MKSFILFSLLAFSVIVGKAQNTSFSGKLTGTSVSLIPEIQVFYDGHLQKISLDKEQKTFNAQLNLKEAQFLEIKSGGSAVNFIYVIPGEDIVVNITKPTINEAVLKIENDKIEGLNSIMGKFYSTINEQGISTEARNWSTELFGRQELASKAIENALKEYKNKEQFVNKLAPQFKNDFDIFAETFKKYIRIDNLSSAEIETMLEGLSKSEMKITVLTIPFYREFIVDLTNAYAARKLESYDLVLDVLKNGYIALNIASEACVKYIPNKGVINYLFYDKINREISINGIKHRNYIDFLFANSGKTVTDNFIKKYETLKANAIKDESKARVDAINFELHDVNGKAYHLADFKGKMLFLDFWASWCAPCKVQIPYLKELEKLYAGKDIVFAGVSLDANKEAWIKGLKDEDLHGVQLHAEGDFKNQLPVKYGINSIPRYILIDADGKIISDNMPRPQSKKELMAIVDADLYKAELNQILTRNFKALGVEGLIAGKGYHVKSKQSMMGIEIEIETRYNYPKNLRYDAKPVENPTFLQALGEDFFKARYMTVRKDTVFGNVKSIDKAVLSWTAKLPGFELFLLNKIENTTLEISEENSTNTDNFYVVKAVRKHQTEKYFIDKADFLIKKVVLISTNDPRNGGGIFESTNKYEDYRNINGLMIPFSLNMNNMITIRVSEAEAKPIDSKVFSIPEK